MPGVPSAKYSILPLGGGQLFLPEKTIVLFIVMGVVLLVAKDVADEFYSDKVSLLHNRHRIVRWGTYVSLIVLIMLTGVFDAGQFIYANF